ncbi:hypothetical protein SCLCIDRAFT_1207140, partial [Scleroderma citrinum Foug A]
QTPTGTKKCRIGVVDDFRSLMDVLTIHIDAPSIGGKLKEQTDGATDAFHITLSHGRSRHGIWLIEKMHAWKILIPRQGSDGRSLKGPPPTS